MTQVAATQIPKPRDEQAFERSSVILFRSVLADPNTQTNGRRGQRQSGVDIFGFRNQNAAHPVGIQCKLKGTDKQLTEAEVREEVSKALTFKPALREYIIVTTAPDDGEIQRVARELMVEIEGKGRKLAISIWGWNTLEQRISDYDAAMQAFDPTYGTFAQRHTEEIRKIGGQQAVVIQEIGDIRREIGGFLNNGNLLGGRTVEQNALEASLDAEIDRYRDILNGGKPRTALALFEPLIEKIRSTASGRIQFRIKANIGHCYLALNDNSRAAHWLSEAYANAPEEPKAIANRALSMLLSERFREAYDYGVSELGKDPSNQWLAPMVIQAAARCSEIDDPMASIPEALHHLEDVESTFLDFLRLRNRKPDWWLAARTAAKSHPDHKLLQQYKAEADLDEIGTRREFLLGGRLSKDERSVVSDAAEVLLERWSSRLASENPSRPDGVAACCNLLAAYQVLGRRADAISIAKQAISVVPDDKELVERAAVAAIEVDDYDLVESLIPKLPDSSNALLLRFQFFAHTANWKELVEVAQRADSAPEREKRAISTMGQLAALMLTDEGKADPKALEKIFEDAGDDLRSNVLVSDFSRRFGLDDVGDRAYQKAIKISKTDTNVVGIEMLARSAGYRNDWSEVVRLLDGHIDSDVDDEMLSLLATAFVNEATTRRRALDFFKNLGESVRNQPFYLTALGLLQSKRGDLSAAATAFEQVLSAEPGSLTALRNLNSVYARQGRSDRTSAIGKYIKKLDLKKIKGTGEEKMFIAHLMRDFGEGQRALEWAYEVIRQHRNDPEVALGYFGLVIGRGEQIQIRDSHAVELDTWVALENNLGEKQQVVIENGADGPADGVYTPNHPFIAPAMGLKVGDSFSQSFPFGTPATWTIRQIKSKYLSTLHEVMETFNVRFPDAKGLYRITTKDGDVSPILDQIKSHSERGQVVADIYLKNKIPLSFAARFTHTETIKFAAGIAQQRRDIATCYGNEAERRFAERLVRSFAGKGAVLDCYTAWVAEALGLLEALKKMFGQIFVPRSAIDELAVMQEEFELSDGPVMTITYRDGQYFREEMTKEETIARAKGFAERRRNLESHCEVVPVDIPDEASELTSALIDQVGAHVLDAAILASGNDRLLLSDDLYFRQIAQQACGAKGTFLQAVISVAASKGLLSASVVADAIVGLAALRHAYVALTPATLLKVAELDDSEKQIKFRAVAEFMGAESAEIYSHADVSIQFLDQVWKLDIPDRRKKLCSGILLEQLLRFRKSDFGSIIDAMRSRLRGNGSASDYLYAWARGHFLR